MCTLLQNRLAQVQTLNNSRISWKKTSPLPVCLDQRRRHLEIWRRQTRKRRVYRTVATSRYCFGASSGLPSILCSAGERCQFLLCNLDRIAVGFAPLTQWGEGMWAYVRIVTARFNVVTHRALWNDLLLFFFSGVCARWTYSDTRPTTSGSITDRLGPMMWRLATQNTHSTVGEALFLSSYFIYITCWGLW